MRSLPLILSLLFCSSAYAAETLDTKPKECNYTVSSKSGARQKSYVCNDFDLSLPYTYTNVCAFKDGSWQFGHLKYIKAEKKHKFAAIKVCDQGITVTPAQKSLDIRSPSIGDFVRGKTDIVSYKKPVYTSHINLIPIESNESPVICYRGESRGVSVSAVACTREPNDANYCEFANTGSKSYLGKWWIQYRLSEKRKPAICLGGVKVAKLDDAAKNYGEEQVKVDVKQDTNADFIKTLPNPSLTSLPEVGVEIAACYIPNLLKSTRITCKNEASVGFDLWVNDQDALRENFEKEVLAQKTLVGLKLITIKAAIADYQKQIARAKNVEQKSELEDKLAALLEDVEQKVESSVANVASKNSGFYPVDKTVLTENQCGIDWDPSNNSIKSVYVKRKIAGVVKKVNCQDIEYYSKQSIAVK